MNVKTFSTTMIGLCAVFAFAATAKDEWTSLANKYAKAELNKDTKAITKMIKEHFSPDLKYIPLRGATLNRDGFIKAELAQLQGIQKFNKVEIKMLRFVEKGNAATSDCTVHIDGLVDMGKGQKPGKLVVDAAVKFKYARKEGKWWATEMKEVSSNATMNGKPVPPQS